MKKKIVVLKIGIDKKQLPDGLCCVGPLIPLI